MQRRIPVEEIETSVFMLAAADMAEALGEERPTSRHGAHKMLWNTLYMKRGGVGEDAVKKVFKYKRTVHGKAVRIGTDTLERLIDFGPLRPHLRALGVFGVRDVIRGQGSRVPLLALLKRFHQVFIESDPWTTHRGMERVAAELPALLAWAPSMASVPIDDESLEDAQRERAAFVTAAALDLAWPMSEGRDASSMRILAVAACQMHAWIRTDEAPSQHRLAALLAQAMPSDGRRLLMAPGWTATGLPPSSDVIEDARHQFHETLLHFNRARLVEGDIGCPVRGRLLVDEFNNLSMRRAALFADLAGDVKEHDHIAKSVIEFCEERGDKGGVVHFMLYRSLVEEQRSGPASGLKLAEGALDCCHSSRPDPSDIVYWSARVRVLELAARAGTLGHAIKDSDRDWLSTSPLAALDVADLGSLRKAAGIRRSSPKAR